MYKTFILQWFLNTPFRALDRAYNASKTVRNIQINFIFYKQKPAVKRSCYNIALYMNTLLEESVFQIYWGLLEFEVSRFILSKICNIFRTNKSNILINNKWKDLFFNDMEYKHLVDFFNANQMPLERITRKLIWIEAAFCDLHMLKHKYLQLSASISYAKESSSNLFYNSATETIPKGVAYESIGLVPRSISRTFSRFKTELASQSLSLILPEFRLVKYQANASIQYVVCLLLFPWLFSMICKILILQPVLENWWNNAQSQVFINTSQQQQALTRLQEIDELFWLDIVLTNASKKNLQDLSGEIHEKTIELVNIWNRNSIHTILHLFTDVIAITCVVFVLTWGKKRLAIFNSWIQELFYSLSDTMKAFFILLFTDLCIGFHSPHGWEMLIAWFLEHLGFAHNKHVISCFVSTFPVILDTVFKYWIFRHLNRISPSIVVTYHTMNE